MIFYSNYANIMLNLVFLFKCMNSVVIYYGIGFLPYYYENYANYSNYSNIIVIMAILW